VIEASEAKQRTQRTAAWRPILVFVESARCGRCRRVDGFLAEVLQHRRNHRTFDVVRIDIDERPELAARLRVERVPAVLVLEDKRVRVRLTGPCDTTTLAQALQPWLR